MSRRFEGTSRGEGASEKHPATSYGPTGRDKFLRELASRPKSPEGVLAKDNPATERLASDREDAYRKYLIMAKRKFEGYQKDLGDGFNIDSIDKYNQSKEILGKLDKEIKFILDVYCKNKEIPEKIIKYCADAYTSYKNNKREGMDPNSRLEDLEQDVEEATKQITRLQQALIPFTDSILAKAGKTTDYDDMHTVLHQFTERIKSSENSEQKKQRLKNYWQWLQEYKQNDGNALQGRLQGEQEAHDKGNEVNINSLLNKSKNYMNNIRVIGSLIERSCPLSLLEEASNRPTSLENCKDGLKTAIEDYRKSEGKIKYSLKEGQEHKLNKLSTVIEQARSLHQAYSDLAESAISVLTKGKGHAQIDSPVSMAISIESTGDAESSHSDQSMREASEDDGTRAERLQWEEYTKDALARRTDSPANMSISTGDAESSHSDQSMREASDSARVKERQREVYAEAAHADSEGEQGDSEESSAESDGARDHLAPPPEADTSQMPERSREQKKKEDKIYAAYNNLRIMQTKLTIFDLRGTECFSLKEIRAVSKALAHQLDLVHRGYYSSLSDIDKKQTHKTAESQWSQLKETISNLLDQEPLTEEAIRSAITEIIKRQEKLREKIRALPEKNRAYSHHLDMFTRQVRKNPEQEGFFQECNSDALKLNMRSREIGQAVAKKLGKLSHISITVAMARMKDTKGNIITAISINEGAGGGGLRSTLEAQEKASEKWTWVSRRTKEGRQHAEKALLDHAAENNLQIVALGASNNWCGDCWNHIEESSHITPEAPGQRKPDQLRPWRLRKKPTTSRFNRPFDAGASDGQENALSESEKYEGTMPEWITSSDKSKISNATKEAIRDLIRENNPEVAAADAINVKALLGSIYVFRDPNNKLIGTDNIGQLPKFLEAEEIKAKPSHEIWNEELQANSFHEIWNRKRHLVTYKGFSAAIPQRNETIRWSWNQLLVLQKKGEKTFTAYRHLAQFATDLGIDRHAAKTLLNSPQSEWKIIIKRLPSKALSEKQIRVITREGEYEKMSVDQPIPKNGFYHFIRKEERKVTGRIFVPKKLSGADRAFLAHIGLENIDSLTKEQIQSKYRAIIKVKHRTSVNGWVLHESIDPLPGTRGKSQGNESDIIVWKY